jgi:hypothetical protein
MMRNLVLDAGAFIAAERWDRHLVEIIAAAAAEGATIFVPAAVIAEVWRTPPRPRSQALLELIDETVALDSALAQRVGALIGMAGSTQIVDGSVALVAIRAKPSIVITADPKDIAALLKTAGETFAAGLAPRNKAPILIEQI